MKRLILFFILFLNFGIFAETGYNGFQWGWEKKDINIGENIEVWEDEYGSIVSFGTIILGDDSIKSYFFDVEKGLDCVSYYIPAGSLEELLSKFDPKKKVYEVKTELFEINDIYNSAKELIEKGTIPPFYDGSDKTIFAFISVLAEGYSYEIASKSEDKGYKNIKEAKEGPKVGTLYIYDYNDDTRVYILSGNIDGLAFVAYVPHCKDY